MITRINYEFFRTPSGAIQRYDAPDIFRHGTVLGYTAMAPGAVQDGYGGEEVLFAVVWPDAKWRQKGRPVLVPVDHSQFSVEAE